MLGDFLDPAGESMNTFAATGYAKLLEAEIERNVTDALTEDIGPGDLTASLVPVDAVAKASVISRAFAVLCGTAWFERCFRKLSASVIVDWKVSDGDSILPDQLICELRGPAQALLTGERTALNFLQMLSGVATKTRQYVELAKDTRAEIVDTRKTMPGLRVAQKFAVKCGGGGNHRLGLYDAVLIKENHILAAGSIRAALAMAQKQVEAARRPCQFIQIEVETLEELQEALDTGAKMILLDNMTTQKMQQAVLINSGRAVLEASGNVSLETVRAIAETGVDRISVGSLTKDVNALDLSMRFESP